MSNDQLEDSIQMALVISTPGHELDMMHGSTTFIGASTLITRLADAALDEGIVEKRQTSNPIRADLQRNFESSFGQNFVIRVKGEELVRKLNDIGKKTFCEVIQFYVQESLYQEPPKLSRRASQIVDRLSDIHEDLIAHIRNPMKDLHKVTEAYGYDITLQHRIEGGKTDIVSLNEDTALMLRPTRLTNVDHEFSVVITRFNHLTGNGRLIIEGHSNTVAFSFSSGIKLVRVEIKKAVSKNLDQNTVLNEDCWLYMRVNAKKLTLRNQKIVKLLISGIVDEQ